MSLKMQTGFRALENQQIADARKAFNNAILAYGDCSYAYVAHEDWAACAQEGYWRANAYAGGAAAAFGEGHTTVGLGSARAAKNLFKD